MSYYDDWVDPNALFRGGSRLWCGAPSRPPERRGRNPRTHLADGCGAKIRIVATREEVTCDNCLRTTEPDA